MSRRQWKPTNAAWIDALAIFIGLALLLTSTPELGLPGQAIRWVLFMVAAATVLKRRLEQEAQRQALVTPAPERRSSKPLPTDTVFTPHTPQRRREDRKRVRVVPPPPDQEQEQP